MKGLKHKNVALYLFLSFLPNLSKHRVYNHNFWECSQYVDSKQLQNKSLKNLYWSEKQY